MTNTGLSKIMNGTNGNGKVTSDVLQGVIPALLGLPLAICIALEVTPLDLLGTAEATSGGMGMVVKVNDKVSMTIMPFDRSIIFTDRDRVDNRCQVSYAGGFADQDVDRLIGWYTLTCRPNAQTGKQIAERLDTSMIVAS